MGYEANLKSHYAQVRRRLDAAADKFSVRSKLAEAEAKAEAKTSSSFASFQLHGVVTGKLIPLLTYTPLTTVKLGFDLSSPMIEASSTVHAMRRRKAICAAHGMRLDEMLGPRRNGNFVAARVEMIIWLRDNTTWSLTRIGRFMCRDHTTIVHHCKQRPSEPQCQTP